MKVLLVSSGSGSRGGGEIFLDYLGKGLADRGHEVTTWIPAHPRMDELAEKVSRFGRVIRSDYRSVYDYRSRTLATAFNRSKSSEIADQWKQLAPDVIHVNKQNLEDGLDLLRAADYSGRPSICTIHLTQTATYLGARAPWLRDWMSRKQLAAYRGPLVAVQETRRQALDDFLCSRVPTRTILNGVPLPGHDERASARDQIRRDLNLGSSDFLVLGVGRLVAQKRPLRFLETAAEIQKHAPEARFLWIGDGDMVNDWDSWVAHKHLANKIRRIGWQTDVTRYLFAGDLLLHVAEYEGLPLAVVEAMAAWLPCAISQGLAAEVTLFDGNNVLFADDPVALAAQIRDRPGLNSIVGAGHRLVEEKLSIERMATSYEDLYREVTAR